jgi:hypothetical protein
VKVSSHFVIFFIPMFTLRLYLERNARAARCERHAANFKQLHHRHGGRRHHLALLARNLDARRAAVYLPTLQSS